MESEKCVGLGFLASPPLVTRNDGFAFACFAVSRSCGIAHWVTICRLMTEICFLSVFVPSENGCLATDVHIVLDLLSCEVLEIACANPRSVEQDAFELRALEMLVCLL